MNYYDEEGDPIPYRFGGLQVQDWGDGPYISVRPEGQPVAFTHDLPTDPTEVEALMQAILQATGCKLDTDFRSDRWDVVRDQ